jgi:hypothetical protein
MHGSICLFSKYLQHLLEGENLNELDISSASSSNNIFRNKNSLSTGWAGTCSILELMNKIQVDLKKELTSLDSIFSSNHQKTINSYETTANSLDKLFTVNAVISPRPSELTGNLVPSFENEFRDKTNRSLIGGEIYYDFTYTLTPFITKLMGNILMIPSADPGYDWIFSHKISGFITMYGGVNSHMSIRAQELGIPAVIGAGELLYRKWKGNGRIFRFL